MHLNPQDPTAAVNRRISIVVLNHRAQSEIEKANAAAPVKLPIEPKDAAQGNTDPAGSGSISVADPKKPPQS
jgi:chemotaxis protein MotB